MKLLTGCTRVVVCILIALLSFSAAYSQAGYWEKLAKFPSAHPNDPLSIIQIIVTSKTTYLACANLGSGIYRSDNRGVSWKQSVPFANYDHGYAIAVHPSGDIFAATNKVGSGKDVTSLSRSKDDGATFVKSTTYPDNISIAALACSSTGTVFIGTTQNGIYRSTDDAATFAVTSYNDTTYTVNALLVAKNGTIYAATSGNGIFESSNNGDTWKQTVNSITISNVACLYQDSKDNLYAGTNYGVYRTKDGGKNWDEILNTGTGSSTVNSLGVSSDGKIIAGVRGEGAYFSNDYGDSWTQITSGLTSTAVSAIGIDSTGSFLVGTFTDMFRSTKAPVLSVKKQVIDFGGVKNSMQKDTTFIITNVGGSPLGVGSMKITGADASAFKIVMKDSVTIEPNTSKSFTVSCLSTNNGDKEATLEFISNTTGNTTGVTLLATVSDPISVNESAITDFSVHVYPNPVSTTATVTINSAMSSSGDIRLVSMLGTPVSSSEFSVESGAPLMVRMPLPESIASGMYQAVIRIGARTVSVPVSVIR